MQMNRKFAYLGTALLVTLVTLFAVTPARAAEIIEGEGQITIDDTIADDVYVFGESIVVNGDIEGDLIAFGQSLEVNGVVSGDVAFFGGWLVINGEVMDDVRAGTALVKISSGGVIGDDLIAGAGSVEMEAGASVGGDLFAGAGQVIVEDVAGNVAVGASKIRFNGAVSGDVKAAYDTRTTYQYDWAQNMPSDFPGMSAIPAGLTFGSDAEIAGVFDYYARQPFDGIGQYVAGSVTYNEMIDTTVDTTTSYERTVSPFVRYLGRVVGFILIGSLLGLIALKLFPTFTQKTLVTLKGRTASSFGIGVLGYLGWLFLGGLYLLLLIGLIALGGLNTGIIGPIFRGVILLGMSAGMLFALVVKWFSLILFALLIGHPLYRAIEKEKEAPYLAFLLGLVIVALVVSIPGLNFFLVNPVIRAFTLGAVLLTFWPWGRKSEEAPLSPETPG